ncbi:MAG TPA: FHA domain-containing protein [Thermoleophilaceae bacterium]
MTPASYDLVLPGGRRLALDGQLTIGRSPENGLELHDPSVSRRHVRITLGPYGPQVEDAGSSSGTWIDGQRIHGATVASDGARIRIGNSELVVERRRSETEAGHTVIVPAGATTAVPGAALSTRVGTQPRLRSGYALKRLDASEGARRWVLKSLRRADFMRLSDGDAALVGLLDGQRALPDLTREAEQLAGPDGPMRLAALLADLSDHGMLAGIEAATAPPPRGWRRLFVPREWTWDGASAFFARLYARGGHALYAQSALALIAGVAIAGVLAFVFLVARRYGTPFVVAQKIGLGGLVFLLGRLAVTAVHEAAHALTMERFGRHVGKAGLKLVLVFPYAFVDTSDAWFESRRRRIAVSAAGPVSDFALGGLFSLCALGLPPGTLRDIFFQLAFAAYVGGIFNLNPFLPRDGYQILVDVLRQPQLRTRANEQLRRRLAGEEPGPQSEVLARYSAFRVAWLALAALFAVAMSLHYEARLAALVPKSVAWVVMSVLWLAFFVPVVLALRPVLVTRARARQA